MLLAEAAKSVGGLLVVDEAYAEFSQELSAVTLISKNPHVLVIRTMSKALPLLEHVLVILSVIKRLKMQ